MFDPSCSSFSEAVLDAVPQIIWTAAPDGTCTYLNRRWYEVTGQARLEGWHPSNWVEAVYPDDREQAVAAWQSASSAKGKFENQFRLRAADDSFRWVIAQATPQIVEGQIVGWCGTCTDIHDRVVAEEALTEREERVRKVLNSIPQVIWSAGPDGHPDFFSTQWKEAFGGDPRDVLGGAWVERVHSDDVEDVLQLWQASLATGSPYQARLRIRLPDGEYRWILAQALPEKDSGGRTVRWYGTCTDVHEHVLAEGALRLAESKLRRTIDNIPQIIWSTLPDGFHDYYSRSWYDFTGMPVGSTDGEGWNDMFHPDDQARARTRWAQSLATGEPYEIEYRLRHHSGEYRWVLGRALPERDDDGKIIRWYGTCTDIHEQVIAEQALEETGALNRSILESTPDCIKLLSLDGTILYVNPLGPLTLAGDTADIVGQCWFDRLPANRAAAARRAVRDAAKTGIIQQLNLDVETVGGRRKWLDVIVTPVLRERESADRVLVIARDITALRNTAEQLRRASELDALTDLPNRRTFQAHLEGATFRAMRSAGKVGLLLLDLDHFKHVNDTSGHAAGDHLLKTFAERLRAAVRCGDFLARLGGDEFAVVLEGVKEEGDLIRAGNSILARLQAPISFEGRALSAGASIGGALYPRDASTAHELFKNADTALYALKAAGRGGTRMFHNHMREEAQKVASQLSLARVALSERSVVPHYQPKIDLGTGEVAGFEALLRWTHPRHGLQQPDTVAEAFKDYELGSRIGSLMQAKVLEDIREWQDQGLILGPVSINAAPAEFLRDDYAERLLERVSGAGVSPRLIEVEVTEHVFYERGSQFVERALEVLHDAGVRIALDDFGTGYSSLSHLRDFPVDVVKIDHSFIRKMLEEAEIGAIVSAVIDLCRSLSIEVVAEGVETDRQRAALAARGCAFGQGYLFGRAAHADEVKVLLRRVKAAA
jgi:diguanylate cyclase (GGDEF)-like protein/PAS domain S-box-containing protein